MAAPAIGIWANPETRPAYECREAEKLYEITKKIDDGAPPRDRYSWRERYCVDMRTRVLHGPFSPSSSPGHCSETTDR